MAIPTKARRVIRDTNMAVSFWTAGFSPQLENQDGTVIFVFEGDADKMSRLEESYWTNQLKLPAHQLLSNFKSLKDRIYAMKSVNR